MCPKGTFPSDFVKLGSEILYLFLAEKIIVCLFCFVLFVLFVATLSDYYSKIVEYTLSIIFVGFSALQTLGLFKNIKNKMCPYNNNYITKDKFRTFGASQALGASDPAPWRPQVYMTLTSTHSVTKMQLT